MNNSDDSTPSPDEIPRRKNDNKSNPLVGCAMMLIGLIGMAYYSYWLVNRKHCYGIFGEEEYTLQDNIRDLGRLVMMAFIFFLAGIGVLRRWRWVKPWVVVVICVGIFWFWDFLFK